MRELPTGTVTLLFTDMEGSTSLLQQLGERYAGVLEECRQLLRTAFRPSGGHEVDTQGDAFFVAFARATDAIAAAANAQRALFAHAWPDGLIVRVRMGLHTGEPQLAADGYVGLDVHHAARIMSAGHGGQVLLSQTTRDLVEHALPEGVNLQDLGAHRLKDLQQKSHLFQLVIAGLPADFPQLKTLESHPHNLPIQVTPFIGRAQEVAEVQRLLQREGMHILTLTGAGGSGKTRLALQVAAELSDVFHDGVYFVNLAPITEPAFVLATIAHTLEIKESGAQSFLDLLKTFLRDKQLLLVLDNFEQVISAAMQVAELIAACPKLKVMVTSRAVLHVRGEQEFAVSPLSVPDPKHLPDLVALSQYEAVALFIQRARAVKADFQVTNANAPAVAEICARLDGLPLAIELAAARIKLLPPQALLARLSQLLAVLTSSVRDVPARQQTLRNTIEWSYNLLNAEEKQLFRRLSVFLGGCTLETVEVVCNNVGNEKLDVLNTVASLIDKSLVQQAEQQDEEPRIIMLETVREYGVECLRESGEEMSIRQAHALCYLSLTEEAEPHFKGAQQIKWWNRMEHEQDNVRTALSWFISHQEDESALRLCGALSWFWYIRGYWREGRQWMTRGLELPRADQRTVARAKVLCALELLNLEDDETMPNLLEESVAIYREHADRLGLAFSLSWLGFSLFIKDMQTARSLLEESIALCQEEGEQWTLALSLEHLGWTYLYQRNFAQAEDLWKRSIALYRELGDQQGVAETLDGLAALAASQGNIGQAEALWKEQLLLSRTLNEKRTTSDALNELGRLAEALGKLSQAEALCQESLTLAQEIGYNYGIGAAMSSLGQFARRRGDIAQAASWAEKNLAYTRGPFQLFDAGQIALDQGNLEQAAALFHEGLSLGQKGHVKSDIAYFLQGFALLAFEQKQLWKAARLFGVMSNFFNGEQDVLGQREYERLVERVRAQLGEKDFATAWNEGRTMTPEQVLVAPEPTSTPPPEPSLTPSAKTPTTNPDELTTREVEVLRLVAQGLSDAQVAEQLVISRRTVNWHLTSIYSKIGVTSRSAATRYAIEHRLI